MIDVEELKRLNERATAAPWGIYADQPSVMITRADDKIIADVDTYTGKGCLDADLIIYLRNHVQEIIQLLDVSDPTNLVCSRCGKPITTSYQPGACYAEDCEPALTDLHDDAITYDEAFGDDAPEERGQTLEDLNAMYGGHHSPNRK